MPRPKSHEDPGAAVLAGSRRGGEVTKAAYADVITKKVFARRVGISALTLRKWLERGVVRPKFKRVKGGVGAWVFTEADVEFGRAVVRIVREESVGRLTVEEAAKLARKQLRASKP